MPEQREEIKVSTLGLGDKEAMALGRYCLLLAMEATSPSVGYLLFCISRQLARIVGERYAVMDALAEQLADITVDGGEE